MTSSSTPSPSSGDQPETSVDTLLAEFSDVKQTPLPQAKVLLNHPPSDFSALHGLLYTVLRTSERSKRTHRLAARAISLNASNPSAWRLRRESAEALAKIEPDVWGNELGFSASVIVRSAKNYQAWEYRRHAALLCGNEPKVEIEFADVVLEDDAKNYHAWSHRAWIVRHFAFTDGELASTEWYIRADVRNNSAWNHRWVVLCTGEKKRDILEEVAFVQCMIRLARNNEAVWEYARALTKFTETETIRELAREVIKEDATCVYALRIIVLLGGQEESSEVADACTVLCEVDSIRKRYWEMQRSAAQNAAS